MTAAIWIIAIVEIIRMLQNFIQLCMSAVDIKKNIEGRDEAYKHFKEALREETAKLFAKRMVEELDGRYKKEESEETDERCEEDQ